MLDHDLLLQIMYDMGFPTDAIDVVKDSAVRHLQMIWPSSPARSRTSIHGKNSGIWGHG